MLDTEGAKTAGAALMRLSALRAARKQCQLQYEACQGNEHARDWLRMVLIFTGTIENIEQDIARAMGLVSFRWRD